MFFIYKWKRFFLMFGLVVGLTVSGCSGNNTEKSEDKKAAVPGGYSKANLLDAEVIEAAEFAANQIDKGKLEKIIEAQTQVVAGVNYKMKILLANGVMYEIIVYKDLNDNLKLTSVAPLK
jgi:hypothetical protein